MISALLRWLFRGGRKLVQQPPASDPDLAEIVSRQARIRRDLEEADRLWALRAEAEAVRRRRLGRNHG